MKGVVHSGQAAVIPTETVGSIAASAFAAGVSVAIEAMRGPRVRRPQGITDDQWINHYGATRNDDGSISAPMSVAHLIPNPAHSKPAHFGYARALASQRA